MPVHNPSALIATFAPLPGGGATARSLFALARVLRRRMHIDLIAPRRRGQRYTESNGQGRVYRVPLGGIDLGPEAEGRFLRAVQRQVRAHAYDVAVVGDPLSALAVRHAGVTQLRIVYALRELRTFEVSDFGPRLEEALRSVDLIVVPSDETAEELGNSGIDRSRVEVMPPYLELRGLIAEEPPPRCDRIILLGFDRPSIRCAAAEALRRQIPEDQILVVPTDGGEERQTLERIEGRLEWPYAWPLRRLAGHLEKGGVAVTLGRSEASAALSLPGGDELLAAASGLPMVVFNADDPPAQLQKSLARIAAAPPPPAFIAGSKPRVADLLAQWLRIMRLDGVVAAELDTQEPTASDSQMQSGSATKTDWIETDQSRVEFTSSSHEPSAITGVVD
jgi:hypothetical protein